jgi:hypothetical protein
MKKLLIAAGILVVLVVGALVALPMFVPVERIKDELVAQVRNATGRDLSIQGKVSVSAFPSLSVQVSNVALSSPAGFSSKDLVRLGALDVRLKLLPVLSGRVEVDSFVLIDPTITLEVDRNGKANWVFDAPDGKNAAPKPAAKQGEPAAGASPAAIPEISLGDVRIANGRLIYIDGPAKTREEVEAIDLAVGLKSLSDPLTAKGALKWRSKAVELALTVAKPLLRGRLLRLRSRLTAVGQQTEQPAAAAGFRLRLRLRLRGGHARGLVRRGGDIADGAGHGRHVGRLAIAGFVVIGRLGHRGGGAFRPHRLILAVVLGQVAGEGRLDPGLGRLGQRHFHRRLAFGRTDPDGHGRSGGRACRLDRSGLGGAGLRGRLRLSGLGGGDHRRAESRLGRGRSALGLGGVGADQRDDGRLGGLGGFRGDAGGDHGHPHLAVQLLVEGRPEDDVGVGVDLVADAVGGFVDLEQGHVHATGDVDQDALGPLHRGVVQQRVGNGGFGGRDGAAVAFGFAGAHHRLAHFAHHGADVGEVQIDQAGHDHQVGDAAHAGIQHVVGHLEGVGEGGALGGDAEQVLVGDDDQGVDIGRQLFDGPFGGAHAVGALEVERLGHHADGQDALVAGGPGDHRGGARSGAAAHAGGDEHHVGAGDLADDFLKAFLGGGAADLGARAGTQPLGDGGAQLDAALGARLGDGLGVGVGDDELDAFQLRGDHVVDGVAAGTADADDGDLGLQFGTRSGKKVQHKITSALEWAVFPALS